MPELRRAIAHGTFNGAMRWAQGGKFEHGFLSGFVSSLGGSYLQANGTNMSVAGKIAISAAIGGTAEALGGGKFANGAVTGAYVMAWNHMMHQGGGEKGRLPKLRENANTTAVADETNLKTVNPAMKISIMVKYRVSLSNEDIYNLELGPSDLIGLYSPVCAVFYDVPELMDQAINGNYWGLAIYTLDVAGGYYSFAVKSLNQIYQSDYMQGSLGNYFLKEYHYWKNADPERARVYLKLSTEHYSNVKKR